jgi:hypothetical protein
MLFIIKTFFFLMHVQDLEGLNMAGLFICDLSMHDFSRDLLLASKSAMIRISFLGVL